MSIKHRVRSNDEGGTKVKELTRGKAIRHHCRECMGFNAQEVRKCTAKLCALYPFRTADDPESWAVSE